MRAALLDDTGVFIRIEDVQQPTDRHLPKITSCDLPTGAYRWIPSDDLATFPQGGSFVPLVFIDEQARNVASILRNIARKRAQLDVQEKQARDGR